MAFTNMSLLLAIAMLLASAAATRELLPIKQPGYNLKARLEAVSGGGAGGLFDCWNALLEIKSCSNEIVVYFLNGEADIGPDCCRAIGVITHNCWPAMLTSLGFTAEEGNILRGYCDASAAAPPLAAVSPVQPN